MDSSSDSNEPRATTSGFSFWGPDGPPTSRNASSPPRSSPAAESSSSFADSPRADRTTPPSSPPPAPEQDDDRNLRTCRICFDQEPPPYRDLISPCLCSGSSRYVHRQCLQTWRRTSRTAFYQCPTCKYRYRLSRLTYAHLLASTWLKLLISSAILFGIIWILGYISEPLLARNLGLDLDLELAALEEELGADGDLEDAGFWLHLLRGTASLGCIGFLKVIYLLGPGSMWNIRQIGGRGRTSRIGWVIVAIGVLNFFWWLWKAVGGFVEDRLGKAAGDVEEVGDRGEEVRSFKEEVLKRAAEAWQGAREVWENVWRGGGNGGVRMPPVDVGVGF